MSEQMEFFRWVSKDRPTSANFTDYKNYVKQDFSGVVMLDSGSLSALLTPPPAKDALTNDPTLEHGQRFCLPQTFAARSVTLTATIIADNKSADVVDELTNLLRGQMFAVRVTGFEQVYFLTYSSMAEFAVSRSGKVSKVSIKCTEYNPTARKFTNTNA